jgi:hypothetical protein
MATILSGRGRTLVESAKTKAFAQIEVDFRKHVYESPRAAARQRERLSLAVVRHVGSRNGAPRSSIAKALAQLREPTTEATACCSATNPSTNRAGYSRTAICCSRRRTRSAGTSTIYRIPKTGIRVSRIRRMRTLSRGSSHSLIASRRWDLSLCATVPTRIPQSTGVSSTCRPSSTIPGVGSVP